MAEWIILKGNGGSSTQKRSLDTEKMIVFIISIALFVLGILLLFFGGDVAIAGMFGCITGAVIVGFYGWNIADNPEKSLTHLFGNVKDDLKKYFSEEGKKRNLLMNIGLLILLVIVFILSPVNNPILDRDIAFFIASGFVILRVSLYLIEKVGRLRSPMTPSGEPRKPTEWGKVISYILGLSVMMFVMVLLFNLIFGFRLWYRVGLIESFVEEIVFTMNASLISIIILGLYGIYVNREAYLIQTEYEQKRKELGDIIFNSIVLVLFPVILLVIIIPAFLSLDITIFGGVLQDTTYEAQAGTDWFSYVFYILFQRPLPAFMIAFMTISAIGVIMAQNLGRIGGFMSSVAIASIAIVPMIVIMSAITGAVDPPPELMEILGLDRSIAGFIYGMGLTTSYVVVVTILGTFVASAKLFNLEWAQ